VYKQRSEEYGPIYKETFGDISTVVISDLDEYDKVIAVDGRYPNRIELMPIVHYRKKRDMGLGTVNGSVSLCFFYLPLLINRLPGSSASEVTT